MISIDNAVTARLETHGQTFEILVDPELADKMRHGDTDIKIEDVVAADCVYENASHVLKVCHMKKKGKVSLQSKDSSSQGDKIPDEDLQKVFNTTDFEVIARHIIMNGEIHLTTEQRRYMSEEKRRRVISYISKNSINPQTKLPNPPARIELALENVRVNFDPMKSVDDLVKETVKALRPYLPIRFEERKIAVKFAMDFASKAYSALSGASYVNMEKNEWQNDGSWICVVSIPAGMQEDFINLCNAAAKGDAEMKILD